jgi:hypothetical protein
LAKDFSYFAFDLKRCDREERAAIGKDCATEEEIDEYLETISLSVLPKKQRLNLLVDFENLN